MRGTAAVACRVNLVAIFSLMCALSQSQSHTEQPHIHQCSLTQYTYALNAAAQHTNLDTLWRRGSSCGQLACGSMQSFCSRSVVVILLLSLRVCQTGASCFSCICIVECKDSTVCFEPQMLRQGKARHCTAVPLQQGSLTSTKSFHFGPQVPGQPMAEYEHDESNKQRAPRCV